MIAALLALAVFVTTAAVDYAHARYARARDEGRALAASLWSMTQWSATTVGFVVAVRVSFCYLPFEALGLGAGTFVAVRRAQKLAAVKP